MNFKYITLQVISYLRLLLILITLIGNVLSFYVFSRKKFKNTIFSSYFRYDIIINLFYLLNTIEYYLGLSWNIEIKLISDFVCKLYRYYENLVTPISHYILAFISIDRYLTIVYPKKYAFKNKLSFHLSCCIGITVFNFIYYIPSLLFFGLVSGSNETSNDTNNPFNNGSISCSRRIIALNYLNVLNDVIVPFSIMTIFTILLIKSIYDSRKRARSLASTQNRTQSKYIRFAVTSIAVNIVFFLLTLPFYSTFFIEFKDNLDLKIMVHFLTFVYDCQFGSMFFVIYLTNSLFRSELKSIIGVDCKNSNSNRQNLVELRNII